MDVFVKEFVDKKKAYEEFNTQKRLYEIGVKCPKLIGDGPEKRGDKFIIKMENVNGTSFRDFLNKKYISKRKKMFCLLFISENIKIMHSKTIKHLDLKPENVIILEKKQGPITFNDVILIDFGNSFIFGIENDNTKEYRTFEHRTLKALTLKTDVQVLGIMLYEVYFGKLPNLLLSYDSKAWDEEPKFDDVEEKNPLYIALENLYKKCMSEDKDKRITSKEFYDILKRILYSKEYNNYWV